MPVAFHGFFIILSCERERKREGGRERGRGREMVAEQNLWSFESIIHFKA
jgi:hypothetical protein